MYHNAGHQRVDHSLVQDPDEVIFGPRCCTFWPFQLHEDTQSGAGLTCDINNLCVHSLAWELNCRLWSFISQSVFLVLYFCVLVDGSFGYCAYFSPTFVLCFSLCVILLPPRPLAPDPCCPFTGVSGFSSCACFYIPLDFALVLYHSLLNVRLCLCAVRTCVYSPAPCFVSTSTHLFWS